MNIGLEQTIAEAQEALAIEMLDDDSPQGTLDALAFTYLSLPGVVEYAELVRDPQELSLDGHRTKLYEQRFMHKEVALFDKDGIKSTVAINTNGLYPILPFSGVRKAFNKRISDEIPTVNDAIFIARGYGERLTLKYGEPDVDTRTRMARLLLSFPAESV